MRQRPLCYAWRMAEIEFIEGAGATAIADWLEQTLRAAATHKSVQGSDPNDDRVVISVPGGSTPFPIFEELVTRDFDFSKLIVWPNDDRIVPENHEASNTGKIRALFEPVGAHVVALFDDQDVPEFDLMWLGMGEDGHIASLFPNTDPQLDDEQSVRVLTPDPLPPHAPFDRITMTLPALLKSRELMFLIRGAEKRVVFDAAAQSRNDLPIARLLRAANQPVTCFT